MREVRFKGYKEQSFTIKWMQCLPRERDFLWHVIESSYCVHIIVGGQHRGKKLLLIMPLESDSLDLS